MQTSHDRARSSSKRSWLREVTCLNTFSYPAEYGFKWKFWKLRCVQETQPDNPFFLPDSNSAITARRSAVLGLFLEGQQDFQRKMCAVDYEKAVLKKNRALAMAEFRKKSDMLLLCCIRFEFQV